MPLQFSVLRSGFVRLAVGSLALTLSASAQWSVSSALGPPYPIPAGPGTGGGGLWPGTLPPAASQTLIPLAAPVPVGATSIVTVWLEWLDHTWSGDLQFVLIDPAGTRFNVIHRPNYLNTSVYGQSCDYAGDYIVVDPAAAANQLWAPSSALCTGLLPQGAYNQYFGSAPGAAGEWPDGFNGIGNDWLSAITPLPGIWTLQIIDWEAGDVGTLYRWGLTGQGGGGPPPAPASYCTAGTTTNGCTASITANFNPSVSFANPCNVTVSNVEGQKNAILFYGLAPAAAPWGGTSTSYLCVKSPTQRAAGQNSGGSSGLCNGTLALDWNAYQTANPSALGQPWLVGEQAFCQAWFRDPPAFKTTNLSNAVMLTYVP